ncbi:ZIP family metal transporter [Massilia phosphatilytica]|nr:ZIP family metal transporter [Massilia phosphatilytica]
MPATASSARWPGSANTASADGATPSGYNQRFAPRACASARPKNNKRLQIDPILISILLATGLAGVVSITAAAVFSFTLLAKVVERMVSLSVGIMLSTSLLHALPEAFESKADTHALFATLLGGLLAFFLLEKVALLRHSHHHEGDGHHHAHGHDARQAGRAGWMILIGDGMHNFTDGILIAAAFLANPQLGIVTGVAIIAHEIPQEIGDFIVLLNAGFSRVRAYVFNLLCSLLAVLGGILGYATLDRASDLIPYVLVFASSGFIYIAVSDLMPQMQRRATVRESIPQVLLIGLGVVIVLFLTHGH